MKKYFYAFLFLSLIYLTILSGCRGHQVLNPKKPITLTLWHNYGGQMKDSMDEMIDEFNEGAGAKKGIFLNVTSISSSATLHEKLTMAAKGDPGAPDLPDITTAYPKTAVKLKEKDLLVDLTQHFTSEELSHYFPQFLEEGKLESDGLYVFPTAKSTEVLFVNTTIFDRFANDTGARLNDLKTFEGIAKTARTYHQWSGGKMFYMPDSLFNFAQVGCQQLGANFLADGEIDPSCPCFLNIWENYYKSAVLGHMAIFDGYASDLANTGDIVCSTGSTAGVVFLPSKVTYEDNITESADYAILPYPTFEGGNKTAIQRGGGMCVIKSNKQNEYGASVFLKWFTSPENNLHFVSRTGYIPVTTEAFDSSVAYDTETLQDENIKKLMHATGQMQEEYDFYIPPLYEDIDEIQIKFDNQLKRIAAKSREAYLGLESELDADAAFKAATEGAYQDFINGLK